MSYNCDDYDGADADFPEVASKISPPENMKLTIEVGLSEYSPSGLLGLIASALLTQIGGPDKWKQRLEKELTKLGQVQAEKLVRETVTLIFQSSVQPIDFPSLVRQAAEEYMNERVDGRGETSRSGYASKDHMPRKEYLARSIAKEAMEKAFKDAETEYKEKLAVAVKETLSDMLALRLAKSLPIPAELKS